MFWNVARAREWDFIVEKVWRYCTVGHLRGNQDYIYLNLAVFTHLHVSFASLENSVISVTKENFPRNRSNCFRRKKINKFYCKIGNQLFNKFTICYHFWFYLAPNISERNKIALNGIIENFQHFLQCTKQTKISMV